MSAASVSGSYQVSWDGFAPSGQRRRAIALIVCTATLRSAQRAQELLELGGVARVAQACGVHRQQHRIEVEALEAAQVHRRDARAVAGDADLAHEAGVARFDRGAQRAVGAHRDVPLVVLHQIVELEQVDVIDAQAFERVADLVARAA